MTSPPVEAILVRVGIDSSLGKWNAPADSRTGEFVYIPIPEILPQRPDRRTSYAALLPALDNFCRARGLSASRDLALPMGLRDQPTHLDPDFDHLTYGDGQPRGSQIARLDAGSLLVFYAGLREIARRQLVYALVGMLTVDQVIPAVDVDARRAHENAHARRAHPDPREFVVRGAREKSGRFARCIPIGDQRDRAYRVRQDLLQEWGGLSAKDGFIQRSGSPPRFLKPERFLRWLEKQDVQLLRRNN